jgi:Protein of unknown function (DUF2975)
MSIERRAVVPLKVFLVGLFLILVVFQTLSFPGKFAYMAQVSPQDAHFRWPLTALSTFWILCAEIIVVSTWRLLTLIERDQIFSPAAFVWADAIVWAIATAWAVLVGVLAYFFAAIYEWDDPGMPMVLLLLVVGVTAVALLMLVMRALLRQATALRTELEAAT